MKYRCLVQFKVLKPSGTLIKISIVQLALLFRRVKSRTTIRTIVNNDSFYRILSWLARKFKVLKNRKASLLAIAVSLYFSLRIRDDDCNHI